MHAMSPRLIWAWLIPGREGSVFATMSDALRGADKHRIQHTGTLAELQYGNVYTCSMPRSRIPTCIISASLCFI